MSLICFDKLKAGKLYRHWNISGKNIYDYRQGRRIVIGSLGNGGLFLLASSNVEGQAFSKLYKLRIVAEEIIGYLEVDPILDKFEDATET